VRPLTFGTPLRSLLVVGAHSDDIEIGCGGTVLRLVAENPGVRLTWLVMCSTPERRDEAQASAEAFAKGAGSVDVVIRDLPDGRLPDVWTQAKDVMKEVGTAAAPEVVLTHALHDLHQDHRLVAELAWQTFRDHLVLGCEIPKYDGDLTTPNLYVALDAELVDRKVELLLAHFPTQAGKHWFHPETFRGLMRVRGVECRAPSGYAEGFHARKVLV
jgi:LmbE family N-acetylglucosaminyl deacetylase